MSDDILSRLQEIEAKLSGLQVLTALQEAASLAEIYATTDVLAAAKERQQMLLELMDAAADPLGEHGEGAKKCIEQITNMMVTFAQPIQEHIDSLRGEQA